MCAATDIGRRRRYLAQDDAEMTQEKKLSFGSLWRIAFALAPAIAMQDPSMIGAVLGSYLINRGTDVEGDFEEQVRASKNHHLQLALAGAFRIALDELREE